MESEKDTEKGKEKKKKKKVKKKGKENETYPPSLCPEPPFLCSLGVEVRLQGPGTLNTSLVLPPSLPESSLPPSLKDYSLPPCRWRRLPLAPWL